MKDFGKGVRARKFTKRERKLRDRAHFGPLPAEGPWADEPDVMEWRDKTTGYKCRIMRNLSGALCGYVVVPESHAAFGARYDEAPLASIEVHGGLTYSGEPILIRSMKWRAFVRGVNRVLPRLAPLLALLMPREWWLGFDCSHTWDRMPVHEALGIKPFGEAAYRDVNYVMAEVARLASQLAAIGAPPLHPNCRCEV